LNKTLSGKPGAVHLGVLIETPIVERPGNVAIRPQPRRNLGRFVDDQEAVKPSAHLLRTVDVRMIPEGPCVRPRQPIVEKFSRPDWLLAQKWHTVLFHGHPQPVPMDGGRLRKPVLDLDVERLALPGAQHWPRSLTIIEPG
jgi:hypothetical protein